MKDKNIQIFPCLMNEKFRHVFDFAITDRAAFSLLPDLEGALIAAAQMETVVVNKDTVLGVRHAKATDSQPTVIDVHEGGRVIK